MLKIKIIGMMINILTKIDIAAYKLRDRLYVERESQYRIVLGKHYDGRHGRIYSSKVIPVPSTTPSDEGYW